MLNTCAHCLLCYNASGLSENPLSTDVRHLQCHTISVYLEALHEKRYRRRVKICVGYATRLTILFSNDIVQSLIDSRRFVSVDRLDRKPCWFEFKSLLLSKYSPTCPRHYFTKNTHQWNRSVISRIRWDTVFENSFLQCRWITMQEDPRMQTPAAVPKMVSNL